MQVQHYKTEDKEKENLHKSFHIPLEKSIYKIKMAGEIPFNFYYTTLTEEFKKDFDKILTK